MTDHWKDVKPWCDAGRFGWIASWDAVDDARAKDAEALERTQAALDKAVETLHGVSRGCESPRSEHVASIGRFVSEGLAEVKRLRKGERNTELAAKDAEIAALKQYIARLEAELETEDV